MGRKTPSDVLPIPRGWGGGFGESLERRGQDECLVHPGREAAVEWLKMSSFQSGEGLPCPKPAGAEPGCDATHKGEGISSVPNPGQPPAP